MIRHGISSLSRLSLFAPLALSACGGDDSVVLDGSSGTEQDGTPSLAIATFEYRSALPACSKTNQSQVYYVKSEDQLYFCDNNKLLELELDCDPSWLTDTIAAKTSVCPAGGTVIRSGADQNENHALDKWEIQSTSTVCNGKDGKNGVNGKDGKNGANGKDGAVGSAGPQGPAGVAGQDGANGGAGTSCSVRDNGDGTAVVTCGDGTSASLYGPPGVTGPAGPAGADGKDGATGPQGPAGANGQDGATGPQGPAGTSCTVVANGDHSYDVTCPDGSHATVHDGQDGQDATLGGVVLNLVPEPKGSNCHAGGVRIDVGVDSDDSGALESEEVTGNGYACAPLITIVGPATISSDAGLEQLRGVREITGELMLTGPLTTAALESATADLQRVNKLYVVGAGLTSLRFDQLTDAAHVEIAYNATITEISIEQLSSTPVLYIHHNPALSSFSFPQLSHADSLLVFSNPVLANLSGLDALTTAGSFTVAGNASLASCEVQRILGNLTNSPYFTDVTGNDAAGICP
ncbi:MAG: hypothetical protein ABW217_21085 [Polyangiaceae bacterium]